MQFFPAVVELKKQIAEGAIGEVKYVHANFGFRLDNIPPRLIEPELGGGATLDRRLNSVRGSGDTVANDQIYLRVMAANSSTPVEVSHPSAQTLSGFSPKIMVAKSMG